MAGELEFFGTEFLKVGSPPDWREDPWSRQRWSPKAAHWAQAREFSIRGLDIKAIWEPSRFEWAVLLSRSYVATGRKEYLQTLCTWLDSWLQANPVNSAPNWKCGQETSIRLLRLLETLYVLQWPEDASSALEDVVCAHLHRIRLTLPYAVAQDNNHGTSEAAALFIGAQWLLHFGKQAQLSSYAARLEKQGASQLVERIKRLVAEDGTFSQYSVNYHRMLLDTLAMVECWSRRLGCTSPLDACRSQVHAAIEWLACLVDPLTGDAPNLGGNDGALLLISPATKFRDHRPTLQLCSCLFRGERSYSSGVWDDASRYWDIEPNSFPYRRMERRSRLFPAGLAFLTHDPYQSWGLLRLPVYRFRPSQADALHLDLWVGNENIIRDSGSFSYNADEQTYAYFTGTRGHSTVEFDGRDQMPRLSRFLYAQWLNARRVAFQANEGHCVSAEYCDHHGSTHRRTVRVRENQWLIEDELSGIAREAILRWHLAPGDWVLHSNGIRGCGIEIRVDSDVDLQMSLEAQWESRLYMQKTERPVLQIRVTAPRAKLTTSISLNR